MLGAGGEVWVVLVKVIGATLDIRDESEGNAVCRMFAVDPLLLLLSVALDQMVDAVIKERMVSEQVIVGDTVGDNPKIRGKLVHGTIIFWKTASRVRCCC